MNNPKISVIVPVYKVEAYLPKCIESIIGQTYENLEIILVDDGSPDGCGAICDEYAAKDDRITVIHQQNAGVSAARNAGLDAATGDYIGFVDSDDWIEPDMYEYLMQAVLTNHADIASCAFSRDRDSNALVCEQIDAVVTGTEAISMLIREKRIIEVLWNKLYRAELWKELRFPVGKRYEDAAVFHVFLDRAPKIIFLPQVKYHYVIRGEGFMQTASFREALMRWLVLAERREYLQTRYPQLQPYLDAGVMGTAMGIWSSAWDGRKQLTPTDRRLLAQVAEHSRRHYDVAIRYGRYGITGRIRLWLTKWPYLWAFGLSKLIRRIYLLKHPEEGQV